MRNAISALGRFKDDEDGAALIEYTVLIGLMLVGVVATADPCADEADGRR